MKEAVDKTTSSTTPSVCYWWNEYNIQPTEYECVLTYCDNATQAPNTTHNYGFTWDGAVIPLGNIVEYPCIAGMAVENSTNYKSVASTSSFVLCGPEGLLLYPEPWPQCSDTVECEDPARLIIPDEILTTYDAGPVFYLDTVR